MSVRVFKGFVCLTLALVTLPPPEGQAADDPALEPFYIASAAFNRKLYPVAAAQFQSFLDKNKGHPNTDLALRGLASSLYALKQYEKAMPHLATLLAMPKLDRKIDRERLIMLQGKCMLYTGKKDDARKLFIEQVKNLRNRSFKTAALATICDISFEKSEWETVIEWTAKLATAGPEPDQAAKGLYQRGFAFHKTQKIKEAIESFSKIAALKTTPDLKTLAAYRLGECHISLEEYDKAEPALDAALPGLTGVDKARCQYQLGFTRFRQKKFEPAKLAFEAYLKQAKPDEKGKPPRYLEKAKFYEARCLLELEDYGKADKKFAALAGGHDLIAAKANLWWARVYTRRKDNYDRAAQILGEYIKRLGNKANNSPLIDDIQFDYANALIGSKEPSWKNAANALGKVEGRGKFGQMEEVVAQRATCLHKIKDYSNSLNSANSFLTRFKTHSLAGDCRFLCGENLYLLHRGDEAAKAYTEFIKSHKEHPNVFAAQMRISQIHHNAKRWDQALASAKPLFAKKPEGKLFAQLSFLVGDCFFRQEKWKDSIQPLEDFVNERVEIKNKNKPKVTVGPNLDTALVQLAVAYDRAGDAEKALGHLFTLVGNYPEVTPHLPLALSAEGRLAYQTGDLKRSRKALERFLKEDQEKKEPFKNTAPGQRPQVNYYLGWVNATENKLVEAAERFSKVPHNDPLGPDAAFQHGIALIKAENFEVAVKHFPEMLKRFKEHEKLPLIMYYAGLSATKQEDWGTASNYFKQVTDNHPKSELADHALYEWAWAERARKHNKEATALYEKLLASHPKSPLVVKVQSEMAELNIDVGAQEKVIEELTSILKTVKDESRKEDIRIQLASAHYKKGDFEIAADMFEQLLTDYPKSKLRGSMLFQAGESRFRIKETVVARDHFAAAAKISGLDDTLTETVMMRLGETQALTNQNKEATKTYQDFLKRFGESKWQRNAQFGLGFALENSNKPSEAINEYRKLYLGLKKVDLWTVRGRFQTGECYFNDKKYEQAIAEFVNIEINFNKYRSWQAKSVLEIGRVLLAQGNRGEAIQRLRDVINRYGKEKAAIVARQYLDELGDPPPTPVTLADTTETEDEADKGTEADTAGTETGDKTDKGPEAPVVEKQFSIFQLGAIVVVIGGILWGLSYLRRRDTSPASSTKKSKGTPKEQ